MLRSCIHRAECTWSAQFQTCTHQADEGDYAGRNRLGLVLRATAQLSGPLNLVSALVSQHVPVWDAAAEAWTAPRATSNPAWIFRWLALGVWIGAAAEGDRRLVAGAGLAAADVDDDGLKLWGAWCDAEELRCDYVVRSESLQSVLDMVAQCGRAVVSWAGGRLGVVWDAADRAATALVTPANIIAGSYRTQWLGERVADEIVGRYIDSAQGWERRTVRRTSPGVTIIQTTTTIELTGVTTRAQAQQEVNLQAARQVYHRRRHEWEMPLGALPAARGDVVYVTHSLIDGGQAGRLRSLGPGAQVTLSEPVTLGASPHLLVSLPDGQLYQSTAVEHPAGTESPSARVVLTPALPARSNGDAWDPLDCIWRLYSGEKTGAVRIAALTPAESGIVRVEAIDETSLYYAAKDLPADVPLPLPGTRIPMVIDAAFDVEYIAVESGRFLAEIAMSLTVAGDWRGGIVYVSTDAMRRQVARMIDGDTAAAWREPVSGTRTINIIVVPGTAAAPLGRVYTTTVTLTAPATTDAIAVPPPPTAFLIEVLPAALEFRIGFPSPPPSISGVEIRYARATAISPTWAAMMPLHTGWITESPWRPEQKFSNGRYVFAARSLSTAGILSAAETRIQATISRTVTTEEDEPGIAVARCPAATGWPGSRTGCMPDSAGDLVAEETVGAGSYAWDDLTTWDAWTSWGGGSGTGYARSISYETASIDLGAALTIIVDWTGTVVGTATVEIRTAATEAALDAATWAGLARQTYEARWVQLRWRVAGDGTQQLRLGRDICYSLSAGEIRSGPRLLDSAISVPRPRWFASFTLPWAMSRGPHTPRRVSCDPDPDGGARHCRTGSSGPVPREPRLRSRKRADTPPRTSHSSTAVPRTRCPPIAPCRPC